MTAAPDAWPDMRSLDVVFDRLAGSPFRRRFRLGPKEHAYLEARGLETVLGHAKGNLTLAAAMLGINRATLRTKMQQLRIKG